MPARSAPATHRHAPTGPRAATAAWGEKVRRASASARFASPGLARPGSIAYLAGMEMKPAHPLRVLVCCYCAARSTLPRQGAAGLVCHGCGAPLSRIETLQPEFERARRHAPGPKPARPHRAERPHEHLEKDRPHRRRKGPRRNGPRRRQRVKPFWERLGDALDDFDDLDDLLDLFD